MKRHPRAILTISNADDITPEELDEVARWLRKTATFLTGRTVAHDGLSKIFRARLFTDYGLE